MKNRIKKHVQVKASELVAHELNPRTHSEAQKAALTRLYEQIGFARSLLAYELPDGRYKLIDGHLRQSLTPDAIVDVEVLDVNDSEAKALLLAIDPLAQLAGYDNDKLEQLQKESAAQESIQCLWAALREQEAQLRNHKRNQRSIQDTTDNRYVILIECADEKQQVSLLRRFKKEGLTVEAKIA